MASRATTFVLAVMAVGAVSSERPGRAEVVVSWTTVGDPGNVADSRHSYAPGAVAYEYEIGRYEVTNSQYAQFLNAVAKADLNGLYNVQMDVANDSLGGIARTGEPGAYGYAAQPGRANKPVLYVSFWDAIRFINWLDNGQPTGEQGPSTTDDGSYTLTPETMANNSVIRNAGAGVVMPSRDEWYKAAYYKGGGTDAGYWDYPTNSNDFVPGVPELGGPASGNTGNWVGNLTDVGAYFQSKSFYGTFDQAGNVGEWNEAGSPGSRYRMALELS